MAKKHLLLVDDEPNIRRILQVAFEKAGYLVSVAENGHEALQIFAENTPDCVLTDVTMPGMTGYELVGRDQEEGRCRSDYDRFGTIPQAVQAIRNGA